MWRTWFIIHRAKYYSRVVTSCNTYHFGWHILGTRAPCNVANFQSVLHMLSLTCDMELVPNSVIETSLLIRHPDEEFGTVPFSFDSVFNASMEYAIRLESINDFAKDHIMWRIRLFHHASRVWLSLRPTCADDISESHEFSRNAAFRVIIIRQLHFANSTHTQTPNQGTLFIVQIKNHRGITLAREARLFPFPFLLSFSSSSSFLFLPFPFPVPFPFPLPFHLFLFLFFLPFPLPFFHVFCPFVLVLSSSFSFCLFFFSFLTPPFCQKGCLHIALPHLRNSIRKPIAKKIFLNFHFFEVIEKSICQIKSISIQKLPLLLIRNMLFDSYFDHYYSSSARSAEKNF